MCTLDVNATGTILDEANYGLWEAPVRRPCYRPSPSLSSAISFPEFIPANSAGGATNVSLSPLLPSLIIIIVGGTPRMTGVHTCMMPPCR